MSNLVQPKKFQSVADRFGIDPDGIVYADAGICYGKLGIRNHEDAVKVSKIIQGEGRTANGGMFDGMPLGTVTECKDNGVIKHYEVTW